ncbi:MAG TPA: Glu/Leu/Phe/Val dehydrogenase dimerization domain-containing protein [Acidimicrobiales bacterium]|nr:Glu/Leu/Phe/Val dehydrogenase dimerization domain-containing protein [Acidimicrobiales bacterium]
MDVFDRLAGDGHEEVVFCHDAATGLRAIIAVHSTRLGPALGGVRFRPYASQNEALEDVLALSRAMTYKAAVAGLDLGGGKAVILGDPARTKTEALLRAYARYVERLGGSYLTAEDVGTTQADMDLMRQETSYVTGTSRSLGGSGDPSAATALGVLQAMRAVAAHRWGSPELRGRRVVVSGVGKVGFTLARHLLEEGAAVVASDVDQAAVERITTTLGLSTVPPENAHAVDCDILSPCALGGVITVERIAELRCEAVVGAANNQLAEPRCAPLLVEAGITYVPDYVANAGGIINISQELVGYRRELAHAKVRTVFDTTIAVLDQARTDRVSPTVVADEMAERRLNGYRQSGPAAATPATVTGG